MFSMTSQLVWWTENVKNKHEVNLRDSKVNTGWVDSLTEGETEKKNSESRVEPTNQMKHIGGVL